MRLKNTKLPKISYWRYQMVLMDVTHPRVTHYEVREIHVDKKGKIVLYTQEAIQIDGENLSDIIIDLNHIINDINKYPILRESELPNE